MGNMLVGETRQLTATVRNANGDELSEVVSWSSSDETTVTVNTDGLVNAAADGMANILAEIDGPAVLVDNCLSTGLVLNVTGRGYKREAFRHRAILLMVN